MHSHHSSVWLCTRQYLYVTFVWAYGCIFAANSSICSFLLPFANSSLRFLFFFSVVHVCGLIVFIIDHIQFHACGFPNEILQRVSFYINICIYFSLYLFIFLFFLYHSSCTRYIFFPVGSFSRAHNYWHIYWYNKISVRYIDQTLFCALFLNAFWEWENTEFWTKYPILKYWKLSDIVTLSNTEGST